MKEPAMFTQDRQTRGVKPRAPQGKADTNATCGCLMLLFFLAVALAAHGYAYQESVRSFVAFFGAA